MRLPRAIGSLLVCVSLVAGGCAHQLPWPPTPADVARINQEAHAEDGYLRIEYVDPIASHWDAHNLRAVAIESIDDDYIGFRTREGETSLLPSDRVLGVTVKDRDLGGLIGVGLGTLAGAGLIAGEWLFLAAIDVDGFDRCFLYCNASAVAFGLAVPAFIGLVTGYAVSGRKTYEFKGRR
jgi:hypothetical protein